MEHFHVNITIGCHRLSISRNQRNPNKRNSGPLNFHCSITYQVLNFFVEIDMIFYDWPWLLTKVSVRFEISGFLPPFDLLSFPMIWWSCRQFLWLNHKNLFLCLLAIFWFSIGEFCSFFSIKTDLFIIIFPFKPILCHCFLLWPVNELTFCSQINNFSSSFPI